MCPWFDSVVNALCGFSLLVVCCVLSESVFFGCFGFENKKNKNILKTKIYSICCDSCGSAQSAQLVDHVCSWGRSACAVEARARAQLGSGHVCRWLKLLLCLSWIFFFHLLRFAWDEGSSQPELSHGVFYFSFWEYATSNLIARALSHCQPW